MDGRRMPSEQTSHSRASETDAILLEPHFWQFHFPSTYFMRPLAFRPKSAAGSRLSVGSGRRPSEGIGTTTVSHHAGEERPRLS